MTGTHDAPRRPHAAGVHVIGSVAGHTVAVVQDQWHGTAALNVDNAVRPVEALLCRIDRASLGVFSAGPGWSASANVLPVNPRKSTCNSALDATTPADAVRCRAVSAQGSSGGQR